MDRISGYLRSSSSHLGSLFVGITIFATLWAAAATWAESLKVGLMDEPKTLNPFAASDVWSAKVLMFLYQRLYYRDPVSDELVPWLASDDPVWDPENRTVTFHLREAQWDDGSPFTAEDVVFTADVIRRFHLPKYWNNWSFVEKVEALDPHTIRLSLAEPMAVLWDRTLTSFVVQKSRWAAVVEKAEKVFQEALQAQKTADKEGEEALQESLVKPLEIITTHTVTNPESLGPFAFKQWQKGAFVFLTRNERFFGFNGDIAGHKVGPYVEGVIFKIYRNADTAVLALKRGDIDYYWWSLESGYLEDLKADPKIKIHSVLKSGYRYLGFNLRRPPINDPEFRHATAYLIDKDFIVQRVLHNEGKRLDTFVPPDNPEYFNPNTPTYGKGLSWRERVEKARTIVKDAGYTWEMEPVGGDLAGQFEVKGRGLKLPGRVPVAPLNLLTPPADYDAQRAQAGNLIQQWLSDFGVPVSWRPMAFSAMTKRIRDDQDFDMYVSGWGALGQDPDYLRSFFHSDSCDAGERNSGAYVNPEFDRLVERQAHTMDFAERRELIFLLQDILMYDLPWIPLYTPMNLEGVRIDRFDGWVEMTGGIGNLWSFIQVKPVK
jgi:peptide/nickel transport system substrate-binding protein